MGVEKIKKEKETLKLMTEIYCRKNHGCKDLCKSCRELVDYGNMKTDNCPFKEEKTFCSNCKVHCYKEDMREKIRMVMKFSGPRMILYHPTLGVKHIIATKKEQKKKV